MASSHERPGWLPVDVWPFELRTLETAGGRVAVTDIGRGPALVFCHAGMWSFLWRDLIATLSHQYRCVTFDPPGSGLSERVVPDRRSLASVRDAVRELLEVLDLDDVTLVLHDLGGPAALAAASDRPERVAAIAAVNTFGWKPTGGLFRTMLALFGSWWMREIDAATGWLPLASTTRFGVGRHLDRRSRRAFRAGMDREARRTMHLLFRSARRSEQVFAEAAVAAELLVDRPLLTVFGQFGDHLRFLPRWRARFEEVTEVTIPRGLHFPMCDAPDVTAAALHRWHRAHVAPTIRPTPHGEGSTEEVG